jgi:hypothetical protein
MCLRPEIRTQDSRIRGRSANPYTEILGTFFVSSEISVSGGGGVASICKSHTYGPIVQLMGLKSTRRIRQRSNNKKLWNFKLSFH